ncbi:MAG: nuclear transport factor 2 family protein [Gemmatimonadaceae bacterium]|nr:nuclear transport factor 2 family protein [Gemmatimonadaceae bacterium]
MSNVNTVQHLYAAFGTGDIPTILSHLHEDVEWEYGMTDAGVPWLQPRRGRANVAQFFESLAALEFQLFQPKTFLESDNIVVALIDVGFVVKATGRKITEEDEVHIWHFDSMGRVTKFCHKIDTHQHWAAFQTQ